MSDMQMFYDQLQTTTSEETDELRYLAAMTHLTRSEIEPLKSEYGWEDWYTTAKSSSLDVGVTNKY